MVVVAGVSVGAVLLRPGGGLGKGRGPLGGNAVVVVLLALAWAAAVLVLASRYRREVGPNHALGPTEQRLADAVRIALVALALGVPLLMLALHRSAPANGGPDSGDAQPTATETVQATAPTLPVRTPHRPTTGHTMDLSLLLHILAGLCIALVAAVVVIAAVLLWRALYQPPEPPPTGATAGVPDERQRLVAAVDSGRRALLDGDDARAAVIACYAAMEESLAASGVSRHASDSPQDLLRRAEGSGLLTGSGAATLTALFREARYSTHPMDAGHRERAAAALSDIAAILDAHRAAEPDTTGATAGTSTGATAKAAP
ncbi:DUF4129 domain-containing protein [Streptomyces sp. NBC_01190]|uniref:DUF4129 domain-containing protein n=1 Tax=Streptomyces sp. NBC_01190 TaxID=2903767 RepID=UPI003863941B|nr:DUF4129 domain-containing protein [Streptomyces sp. NBC_01190]